MTTFSLRLPRRAMIAAALTFGALAGGATPALALPESHGTQMGAVEAISQKYTMFLGEFDATKNELAIETIE